MQEMDTMTLVLMILYTVFGIIGLVLMILDKKNKIKPIMYQTKNGINYQSGGKIVLCAALVGAFSLENYSMVGAIAYAAIFIGAYFFIYMLFKGEE